MIAAYGEHVVMKETLAEALSALFMESPAAQAVSSTTEGMPLTSPTANQARQALDRYNQAVKRLKSGDWKGFGTEFDAMRELLEEMNRGSSWSLMPPESAFSRHLWPEEWKLSARMARRSDPVEII